MKPWIAIALCAASCMNGRSKTSSDAMDRVDRMDRVLTLDDMIG